MKFIKDNFLTLIVLVLIAILFLQRCTEKRDALVTTITKDSIIIIRDTSFLVKPILIKSKRDTIKEKDSFFLPSENYGELKEQFIKLREELLALNVYNSSSKFDSSSVTIHDTIQGNKILSRSVDWNLKYPILTVNNFIPIKPKNQLYVGGQLLGGATSQINLNLLFKNKKDQIFGGGIGINSKGNVLYNVQSYWKIKL